MNKNKLFTQFDRVVLFLEAILIVLDLMLFGSAKTGMICYWVLVSIYHVTDFFMNIEKKDEDVNN